MLGLGVEQIVGWIAWGFFMSIGWAVGSWLMGKMLH